MTKAAKLIQAIDDIISQNYDDETRDKKIDEYIKENWKWLQS